jgi:hypothetical protein
MALFWPARERNMPVFETRVITASVGAQPDLRLAKNVEWNIVPPTVYTEDDLKLTFSGWILPVELAAEVFPLPIKTVKGAQFAWLNPSGKVEEDSSPELMRACAIETGARLARKMEENETKKAILLEAPSSKTIDMGNLAGQIAADLTGGQVLIIKAEGGVIDNVDLENDHLHEYFSEEESADLRSKVLGIGEKTEPIRMTTLDGETVILIRYKPVTGKEKFMFLSQRQYADISQALEEGAILATIEDVVTTGTTVSVEQDLLRAGQIEEELAVIAVAKEGDGYSGNVDCAIKLPKL